MKLFHKRGEGGSHGFHTSIYFFKHPSKSSFFRCLKLREKKGIHKRGTGGSPFHEVISQKICYLTKDGFPYLNKAFCEAILHLLKPLLLEFLFVVFSKLRRHGGR